MATKRYPFLTSIEQLLLKKQAQRKWSALSCADVTYFTPYAASFVEAA